MSRQSGILLLAACAHPGTTSNSSPGPAVAPVVAASTAASISHVPDGGGSDDLAPTQVYVTVRAHKSETELRTRVTGMMEKVISVPGSAWQCTYRNLLDSKPSPGHQHTIKYPMRLHAVDCTIGTYGVSVSVMCPVSDSNTRSELATRDILRIAELVVLLEQQPDGEHRNFVSIDCEP
jgi:hypothetical protein